MHDLQLQKTPANPTPAPIFDAASPNSGTLRQVEVSTSTVRALSSLSHEVPMLRL